MTEQPVRQKMTPKELMIVIVIFLFNNLRQPLVAQIWYGLNNLLEPLYSRIRRFLPATPGIDLAPLVAFIILIIIRQALYNNQGFFYGY